MSNDAMIYIKKNCFHVYGKSTHNGKPWLPYSLYEDITLKELKAELRKYNKSKELYIFEVTTEYGMGALLCRKPKNSTRFITVTPRPFDW